MGFSKEWDELYKSNLHLSIWPWSDLVSYVMRYARPKLSKFKVLELGCGAGANIPFFMSLGVEYYAIDGSKTIVQMLKKRFNKIAENIIVGDFTKEIPFPFKFNLIVDRGAVTCNTSEDIKRCMSLVYDKLINKARYIGIDYYSTEDSDFKLGKYFEDRYTKIDIENGPLAGTGRVHFSDKKHLMDLFDKFSIEVMEHKIIKSEIPADRKAYAFWNIVAKKD